MTPSDDEQGLDQTLPASDPAAAPSPANAPAALAEALPERIDRYRIDGKLGAGGMGVVLLATDPTLARRVALKVLRADARHDTDEARRRLVREAQSIAQVTHDNVIVVHEVGTHDGRVFVAMEYVPGGTLARWQVGRDWRAVLAMYERAGRGLAAAHDAGLVHRDFKPDNVLVGDDGRVRVTDFGLVASASDEAPASPSRAAAAPDLSTSLTRTGAVLGTPRYMAPEQHLAEPLDARADQFAFCVALHEALFGRPPFEGATYAELAERVIAGDAAPVPPGSPVPPSIQRAIARGLSRRRDDRFPSMRELLAALAIPTPPPPRHRGIIAAVVVFVVLAIAAVIVLRVRADAARSRAEARRSHDDAERARRRAAQLDRELLALKADPEGAAPGTSAQAKVRFNRANDAYNAGRYDEAAQGFLEAYASRPFPEMLYNASAAFYLKCKRAGDAAACNRAIELDRQYLTASPDAPDREQVNRQIAGLTAEAARLRAATPRR